MVGTDGAKPERHLQLVTVTRGEIKFIRELSVSEGDAYLAALDTLLGHDRGASLIEIARRNHTQALAAVKQIQYQIPTVSNRSTLQREAEVELNRVFLNFLSSMRQFLDHTETRLKRTYKNVPAIFGEFKIATAAAYDRLFAYRFLYKLRNYAQHCGPPIGQIDLESKAMGNSGFVEHIVHLRYDPVRLLKDGGDIWGNVKKDLTSRSEKFDAIPLAEEVMRELESIWNIIRATEREQLITQAKHVVDLLGTAKNGNSVPGVLRVWRRKRSTTMEFHHAPGPVMAWLGFDGFRDPV